MKFENLIALCVCVMGLAVGPNCPASAQSQTTAGSANALQHWNAADEISISGTIHEVVTEHTSGTPTGVNLLLDGAQPFQYANLGAQLNSSIKSELSAGQSITLKGIVRSFGDQKILMVRELTIGQQTTQVRSTHGIVSPFVEASAAQGNRPRSKNTVAGGAQ